MKYPNMTAGAALLRGDALLGFTSTDRAYSLTDVPGAVVPAVLTDPEVQQLNQELATLKDWANRNGGGKNRLPECDENMDCDRLLDLRDRARRMANIRAQLKEHYGDRDPTHLYELHLVNGLFGRCNEIWKRQCGNKQLQEAPSLGDQAQFPPLGATVAAS